MKTIVHAGLMSVLVTALVLTGACANIANDRTRTQTEGTLAGAGLGALIGAGIGAAVDGRKGALTGALIGAGVGGMAGLAYGTSVANKKAEYASEEAWLNACLDEAKKVNQEAAAYNSRLKNTLAGYKASGAQLDKKQGQALKRDLKESQDVLAGLDYQISSQEKVVSSTGSNDQTKQLKKQIAELKKQKQVLEKQNQELASISNRVAM